MKLFGKGRDSQPKGAPRPVILAMLEGWGMDAAGQRLMAPGKTPAFDRLARRAGVGRLTPASSPRDIATALAAITSGSDAAPVSGAAKAMAAAEAPSVAETAAFRNFVRRLRHVGGDCHLIAMVTPSDVETDMGLLSVIAASLSHEGIRVWLHAVLDGRDAPPDSALNAISEFMSDTAGAEHVQLATVSGRALAFDAAASSDSLAAVRAAIVEADPQVRDGLDAHIETSIRRGLTDALMPPAASPAYPGLRGEDAVLIVHPRPDGFDALRRSLVTDTSLKVSTSRPLTLSGMHRLMDWPEASAGEATAPLFPFTPPAVTLPAIAADGGVASRLYVPQPVAPVFAPFFEAMPLAESHAHLLPDAMAAGDATVEAVKSGHEGLVIAWLGGAPGAARGGDGPAAKRFVEMQDKALGRIAAIVERRNGTLLIAGSDRGLAPSPEGPLPFLAYGPGMPDNQELIRGSLADLAPTALALLGIAPAGMSGSTLLEPAPDAPGSVHARAV